MNESFKKELADRMARNEFKMMRGLAHHKEDMKINDQEHRESLKASAVNAVNSEFHTYTDVEKEQWRKFASKHGYGQ